MITADYATELNRTKPLSADVRAIVDAIDRNTAAVQRCGCLPIAGAVRGEGWPSPLMPADWLPPPNTGTRRSKFVEDIGPIWGSSNPPCALSGDGS